MQIWSSKIALNIHVEHNSNTYIHFSRCYMRNCLIWKQKQREIFQYSVQRHTARIWNNVCIYVVRIVSVRYIKAGSGLQFTAILHNVFVLHFLMSS